MKTKILSVFTVLLVLILSILAVSCGKDEDKTGIETTGFVSDNGIYKVTVPNSTKSYDLLSKITFEKKTEHIFSTNKNFSNELKDGKITLKEGDNFVYLKVTDKKDHKSVYTFNIYRKKMVTVTFNPNGGAMGETNIVVQEGTVISKPTASKAGHSLSWDYDFTNPVTSNVVINAVWTPFDCVINATVNGVTTTHGVVYGQVPSNLPSLDIFGYVKTNSTGWVYDNVDFDPTAPFTYNDTEINIVAAIAPIEYTIVYHIDSNVTNNEENVSKFTIVTENGEAFSIVLYAPLHSSDNYEFVGWSFVENSDDVVTNITLENVAELGEKTVINLYPVWKINVDVIYSYGEGTCEKDTDTLVYGKAYELPVPSLEDYAFEGWYYGEILVTNSGVWAYTEDVELVAKWSRFANDIHYVLNTEGVTNNSNPDSFNIEDGQIELVAPEHSSDNYEFAGWYSSPNFSETSKVDFITSDMVENVVILYAKWEVTSNVTLDSNGGSCELESAQIKVNEEYTLPIPTKDKYDFAGWYNGTEHVSLNGVWTLDTDIELVAKWEPKEFQVIYETNGGVNNENNPGSFTVETNPDDLGLENPTKEYCIFAGWYLDPDFTIPVENIDPTAYNDDVKIYAKWETKTVEITYNANGGDVAQTQVVINLGDNYKLLIPVRSGYDFVGWYLDDVLVENTGRWTNEEVLALELIAKWNPIEYTITYDLNGGSYGGTLVKTYTVESESISLPKPTRSGYYFAGWSLDGGYSNLDVVISKGSVGNLSYKAHWAAQKDSNGILYSMVDDKLVVVGIDRVLDDTIISGIKIPSTVEGVEVVAIESNAFKAFGEKFTKSKYANMSNSYVIFSIPTTIKKIGAGAFETCNGIKVSLYDPNASYADYKAWDSTTIWEPGNEEARDCIWGFRPAIGWTRYSKVEIPEDYE